jgi:hypothetical protein
MANEEFPTGQFLQAYQQKYANEQAANPDIGQTLASGLTTGMNLGMTQFNQAREEAKKRTYEGFKDYTKNGEWFYGNDPEKKLSFEDIAQINDLVGKGDLKFKTNKDGILTLANNKGVPLNINWKKSEVSLYGMNPTTNKPEILGTVPKGSKAVPKNTNGLEGSELSPEAIENTADIYNQTGVMPSLGMGNAKVRTAILNKAAERAKEQGMDAPKLIGNRASYRAASQGLASASGINTRLQDAKVNQAIDLKGMLEQNYNPQTGEYSVPPSLHSELVLGLARLLSPTGQIGVELMKELKQKTAKEGLAGALIYLGFDPKEVGGSTQDVIKMFAHTIDRQGEISEGLRNQYIKSNSNFKNVDIGNSYLKYRKQFNHGTQNTPNPQTMAQPTSQPTPQPTGTKLTPEQRQALIQQLQGK